VYNPAVRSPQPENTNSSRNALKHGALSGTLILKCEPTDRFENLVVTLFEEFHPQTPFEVDLIEDVAVAAGGAMTPLNSSLRQPNPNARLPGNSSPGPSQGRNNRIVSVCIRVHPWPKVLTFFGLE
jgi:hypothetical protein